MDARLTAGFAEVYRDHHQGLFTLALSVTRDPSTAEDALQEAFTRLLERDPSALDPVAYAYGAVRRAAIDQCRRAGARGRAAVSIYADESVDAGVDAAAAYERAESDRRLQRAVDALPDDERCCVVMRVYAELTFQQMATALGDPISTLSSRYQRALARLRAALAEEEV